MPKYSYYGFGIAIVRGYVIDGEVDHSIITACLSFLCKVESRKICESCMNDVLQKRITILEARH